MDNGIKLSQITHYRVLGVPYKGFVYCYYLFNVISLTLKGNTLFLKVFLNGKQLIVDP
jgi:hypothetical protein